MKQISNELKTHLEGEVTSLATCWKVTRKDGVILGFTDHDVDIVFELVNYEASTGFTPTAVQSSAGLAVDNLDIDGMLDSGAVTEADIAAGLYDFAEIEIFMVNYNDLTQGALKLRRGWLGEVSYSKSHFVAEVRGLAQRLSQKIGDVFSPLCRADLGDARCGVDLSGLTVTGTITSVESRQVFADSLLADATGYFNFGKITFTSGANAGLSMEVKNYVKDGNITLALPMPFDVLIGDDFEMHAGCDKNFETCVDKFSNAVNFRGEPHVPGLDKMLETAGTRSKN